MAAQRCHVKIKMNLNFARGVGNLARVTSPLGPDWWGVRQVAKFLGVQDSTVRSWVSRQRMPDPDGHVGRTPVWRAETIRTWAAQRPRKGQPEG